LRQGGRLWPLPHHVDDQLDLVQPAELDHEWFGELSLRIHARSSPLETVAQYAGGPETMIYVGGLMQKLRRPAWKARDCKEKQPEIDEIWYQIILFRVPQLVCKAAESPRHDRKRTRRWSFDDDEVERLRQLKAALPRSYAWPARFASFDSRLMAASARGGVSRVGAGELRFHRAPRGQHLNVACFDCHASGRSHRGDGWRDQDLSRSVASRPSPPYLHDGRLLTLEATVEFFNLVLGTKLTRAEKQALVAFMQAL
jgi:hypothetical protein